MNNFEVVRLLNGMIDDVRTVSIKSGLSYINSRLSN